MTETESTPVATPADPPKKSNVPEDPGMMESVGSFPCWMLKIIDTITPDSLRTKEPPKKNYRI